MDVDLPSLDPGAIVVVGLTGTWTSPLFDRTSWPVSTSASAVIVGASPTRSSAPERSVAVTRDGDIMVRITVDGTDLIGPHGNVKVLLGKTADNRRVVALCVKDGW